MMHKIHIKLIDCRGIVSSKSFDYLYNENTLVCDLYKSISERYVGEIEYDKKSCQLGFAFWINGEYKYANINYPLDKFIINWELNKNDVIIQCNMVYGIGAGITIKELAKIRINPDEGKHQYLPHVHIIKINKSKPQYRISLKDFRQLDSDTEKWERVFGRRQREKIISVLKDNQETLIDYYERIQKGEYIMDRILVFVDGKYIEFK